MRILFLFFGLFFSLSSLRATTIDILTSFWQDLPSIKLQDGTVPANKFRILNVELDEYVARYYKPSNVDWIVLLNPQHSSALLKLPKEKLILFVWEPDDISTNYLNLFKYVYTYNDAQIDNLKYFKFCYPFLRQPSNHSIPFENRKLCTLVARHWIPKRIQILDFFNRKPQNDFEFYGTLPHGAYKKMYKGTIPGTHSGEDKIKILQNYRFCICFENTAIPGYITEKIFACFAAGCVPIYWGAQNILDYIPADCFIDYRSFKNDEELYQYLQTMPKEIHDEYLKNISQYLASDQAKCFSQVNFKKIFHELIKK